LGGSFEFKSARTKHPYLMWEDIQAESNTVKEILKKRNRIEDCVEALSDRKFNKIILTGSGTSFNNAILGAYAFREITNLPSAWAHPFELAYYSFPKINEETMLIAISQTGGTKEVSDAIKLVKLHTHGKTPHVVALTTVPGSPVTQYADSIISFSAAREEFVKPTTKAYVGGLTATYLLALEMRKRIGLQDRNETFMLETQLNSVPDIMNKVTKNEEPVIKYAEKYKNKEFFTFIGGGANYATAIEASLKMREAAHKYSEAKEVGELPHGHFVALNEKSVAVAISPFGKSRSRMLDVVKALNRIGVETVSVITEDDTEFAELSREAMEMPGELSEVLTPLVYIVPLQLLAYHTGVDRGVNPDLIRTDDARYRDAWFKYLFPPGSH